MIRSKSRAFSESCPECSSLDFRPETACLRCDDQNLPEAGSLSGHEEREQLGELRFLKLILKPLGVILALLGLPICFLFGVGLSDRRRLQLFGGVALFVLFIGRFGIGPQLAGAAVVLAVAVGCLEITV